QSSLSCLIYFLLLFLLPLQQAKIVAGGNGDGSELNQLKFPKGIFVDQYQGIFIADADNHRIVQWKLNQNSGKIVAGGKGNRTDQLNVPTDVIVDEENNSLIITDCWNRRVIRWFNETNKKFSSKILDVLVWKIGEMKGKKGIVVAGGNGKGNQMNQLNLPHFIFVDDEQSIYVSDSGNHRVMKWRKDAKEGIVVAGGNGQGKELNQLIYPQGIIVDDFGQIYVTDSWNNRIMRWNEGKREGEIIVGGNGEGNELNQLLAPTCLSFDVQGKLKANRTLTNFLSN
ncbi:unnamed protein product, partial [Adineta ricciae]